MFLLITSACVWDHQGLENVNFVTFWVEMSPTNHLYDVEL